MWSRWIIETFKDGKLVRICLSAKDCGLLSFSFGSLSSSQSEYESAVKNFGALENQWLNEPDSLQQETLYKSVFDAEVAFAAKL